MRELLSICVGSLDRRSRRVALAFAAGSCVLGALDLVGVVAIGLLIQRALIGSSASSALAGSGLAELPLLALGIGGGAILIVKSCLSVVITRMIGGWAARQEARESRRLFGRVLRAPLGRVERLGSHGAGRGVLLGGRLLGQALAAFLALIGDIAVLAMLTLLLFVADPQVAAASIAFFGVVLAVGMRWSAGRISSAAQSAAEAEKDLSAEIEFAVALGREVRLRELNNYLVGRFDRQAHRYASGYARQFALFQFPRFYLEIAMVVGLAVVASIALAMSGPERGLGVIGLFLVTATRLVPALVRAQGSVSFLNMSQGWIPLREAVVSLGGEAPPGATVRETMLESNGSARLFLAAGLHLGYDDEGSALRGVDVELTRGDRVAFIGASGSGKSTMLDVIAGLRAPGDGTHRGSGVIVRSPGTVAYVPQSVAVFQGSIAENVALTDEGSIDEDRLWRALRGAELSDHVDGLPDGVRSPVLGAFGLSGGQRQRLGLARALYAGPDILILDEPTSALDYSTERRVMSAVLALPRSVSVVVVAHRLDSIRAVDRVYLFADGRIVDVGGYAEVASRHDRFFAGMGDPQSPEPFADRSRTPSVRPSVP